MSLCLIKDIEIAEHDASHTLPGFKHLINVGILSHLHLPCAIKLSLGMFAVNANEFFRLNTIKITHGHAYWLHKQYNRCSTSLSFFAMRVINIWNYLPADVVEFSS